MAKREDFIAQVVQAASGKLVGRIRIQKMIYLLQQLGAGTDFKFSYHHYGPYSEEVAMAIQRAIFIEKSIEETEISSSYGGFYSEFKLVKPPSANSVGDLKKSDAQRAIPLMTTETSVVLELAATIHWLKHKEKVPRWEEEVVLRKPGKASGENISRAINVLSKLGLAA